MKKIIGIFPTIELFQGDDPYQDRYEFINNYPKKVFESNAVAIGILLNNGDINYDVLDMCDAFILPGGHKININIYRLLYYAYQNKKPVLGICLGMQAMGVFSIILDECINNNVNYLDSGKQSVIYDKVRRENPMLEKIDNDNHLHVVNRDNIDMARHNVNIDKKSLVYKLYNKESISGVSLHGIKLNRVGSILNVAGMSDDGVIEIIENKELKWIGVQFHVELDSDSLINKFIDLV